jgi:thioredoxin reductase
VTADRRDVLVVGGGPAGLSAALILGRCLRHVLVCDNGQPRNTRAPGVNGFLTRDGVAPAELRRLAREQLARYETVELRDVEVTDIVCQPEMGFFATLSDGTRLHARYVLLATGVRDELPQLPGFDELYGKGVFHCPYCDGWELRGQPLAAFGRGRAGEKLALELTAWSDDVVLLTDGKARLSQRDRERLTRASVVVREDRVAALEGSGSLERVRFADGSALERRGLFFANKPVQRSSLAERLGCRFTRKGAVSTGEFEMSIVPGVFVVGDASHDVQMAIVAAAEGARAAFSINQALIREDLSDVGAAKPPDLQKQAPDPER